MAPDAHGRDAQDPRGRARRAAAGRWPASATAAGGRRSSVGCATARFEDEVVAALADAVRAGAVAAGVAPAWVTLRCRRCASAARSSGWREQVAAALGVPVLRAAGQRAEAAPAAARDGQRGPAGRQRPRRVPRRPARRRPAPGCCSTTAAAPGWTLAMVGGQLRHGGRRAGRRRWPWRRRSRRPARGPARRCAAARTGIPSRAGAARRPTCAPAPRPARSCADARAAAGVRTTDRSACASASGVGAVSSPVSPSAISDAGPPSATAITGRPRRLGLEDDLAEGVGPAGEQERVGAGVGAGELRRRRASPGTSRARRGARAGRPPRGRRRRAPDAGADPRARAAGTRRRAGRRPSPWSAARQYSTLTSPPNSRRVAQPRGRSG